MKRIVTACTVWMLMAGLALAADAPKLKGLWITGGCCHDYKKNGPLLTEKIAQYASASFKIVDQPDALKLLKTKGYADAYDVVVYDMAA